MRSGHAITSRGAKGEIGDYVGFRVQRLGSKLLKEGYYTGDYIGK